MTPFAIAGVQMHVSATESNLGRMRDRLATLTAIYPWVRMVVFSELAVCGPLPSTAEPDPGTRRKKRYAGWPRRTTSGWSRARCTSSPGTTSTTRPRS